MSYDYWHLNILLKVLLSKRLSQKSKSLIILFYKLCLLYFTLFYTNILLYCWCLAFFAILPSELLDFYPKHNLTFRALNDCAKFRQNCGRRSVFRQNDSVTEVIL